MIQPPMIRIRLGNTEYPFPADPGFVDGLSPSDSARLICALALEIHRLQARLDRLDPPRPIVIG
jgi:hypothetical protein